MANNNKLIYEQVYAAALLLKGALYIDKDRPPNLTARTMSKLMEGITTMLSRERAAEIAVLVQQAPVFQPTELLQGQVLPQSVAATLLFSSVFVALLQWNRSLPTSKRNTLCYRLTNMFAYVTMGSFSVYGQLYEIPKYSPTPYTAVQGLSEHTFALSLMVGFQFWALAAGLFFVKESRLMLTHHVLVLLVSLMFACCTNGYRYYGYYFTGIWEISSIPLVVMNLWKDNPEWSKRYPQVFQAIRASFAVTFIYLRLYIGLPKILHYLTDFYSVVSTPHGPLVVRAVIWVLWVMSVFLTFLQLYWGALIGSSLFRLVFRLAKSLSPKKKSS